MKKQLTKYKERKKIKIHSEPFSRPSGVSSLFVVSAQRACFDRPYRWLWYYCKYNREFTKMAFAPPIEVAKWMSYILHLLNDQVIYQFNSPMDYKMYISQRIFYNSNFDIFDNWKDELEAFYQKSKYPNPLLDIAYFLSRTCLPEHPLLFARNALSQCYSRSIPTYEILQEIKNISPKILECGYACTGYWSYLLQEIGCDVKCLSVSKPYYEGDKWQWLSSKMIVDIRFGDYFKNNVGKDDDRALLYVSPTDTLISRKMNWNESDYISKNGELKELKYWKGNIIIIITPIENTRLYEPGIIFFPTKMEKNNWDLIKTIKIPQWLGFSETMKIYRRRK